MYCALLEGAIVGLHGFSDLRGHFGQGGVHRIEVCGDLIDSFQHRCERQAGRVRWMGWHIASVSQGRVRHIDPSEGHPSLVADKVRHAEVGVRGRACATWSLDAHDQVGLGRAASEAPDVL